MKNIKSYLKIIYQKFSFLIGKQRHLNGIGIFHVPIYLRGYLKHTFSQQGEDLSFERIWLRILNKDFVKKGVYVDLGAYHPIEHSVTYNLYRRGWHGLAVDASNKTKQLYTKYRPKDIFVEAVIGARDENEVSFYFSKYDELSLINSKYPSDPESYIEKKLPQLSVNTILRNYGVSWIDFLNIDIEGAELEILETLDFDLYNPLVIAVEIHSNDIRKGIEHPISMLLCNKGYTLCACNVITYFFVRKENLEE